MYLLAIGHNRSIANEDVIRRLCQVNFLAYGSQARAPFLTDRVVYCKASLEVGLVHFRDPTSTLLWSLAPNRILPFAVER